jgi:hypothetical protein
MVVSYGVHGFSTFGYHFLSNPKRSIAMKTLSIVPAVPTPTLKWWIPTNPFLAVRKVFMSIVTTAGSIKQDQRTLARPSSECIDYFMLMQTVLYLAILVIGCRAIVQIFSQWATNGSNTKWFPIA